MNVIQEKKELFFFKPHASDCSTITPKHEQKLIFQTNLSYKASYNWLFNNVSANSEFTIVGKILDLEIGDNLTFRQQIINIA